MHCFLSHSKFREKTDTFPKEIDLSHELQYFLLSRAIRSINFSGGVTEAVAFHPTKPIVARVSFDKTLYSPTCELYCTQLGVVKGRCTLAHSIQELRWSNRRNVLATLAIDGTLQLFALKENKKPNELPYRLEKIATLPHEYRSPLGWSPDDRFLTANASDYSYTLYYDLLLHQRFSIAYPHITLAWQPDTHLALLITPDHTFVSDDGVSSVKSRKGTCFDALAFINKEKALLAARINNYQHFLEYDINQKEFSNNYRYSFFNKHNKPHHLCITSLIINSNHPATRFAWTTADNNQAYYCDSDDQKHALIRSTPSLKNSITFLGLMSNYNQLITSDGATLQITFLTSGLSQKRTLPGPYDTRATLWTSPQNKIFFHKGEHIFIIPLYQQYQEEFKKLTIAQIALLATLARTKGTNIFRRYPEWKEFFMQAEWPTAIKQLIEETTT